MAARPVPRLVSAGAALLLALPGPAAGQGSLAVIRARSRVVTVVDGPHVKRDYWYIMPERAPDVYYVEIPFQPHAVVFRTDLDSIALRVSHGERHRFVIRLDDGTEALTEVRAELRDPLPWRRASAAPGARADTIPFTLGDNDKIYLKGSINGGRTMDFQFDLGASFATAVIVRVSGDAGVRDGAACAPEPRGPGWECG